MTKQINKKGSGEDAVKAVVRWELDLESMESFNRTCRHRIKKCYLGAKIEDSVIVADHLFLAMSPRLQRLGSGCPNGPNEHCVFFVSTGTRWID